MVNTKEKTSPGEAAAQVEMNPDDLKVFVRVKGDQLQVNPWQPRGSRP